MLANHLSATNPHVAALFDRGCVLSFEPSAGEVHDRVAGRFTDREIHDFFGRWLPVIPTPSMRPYGKAAEMKAAGIDWRAILMGQWKAGKLWRVEAAQANPKLATEEDRAAVFVAARWGSRATYFRHLDRWRKAVGARPVPDSPPG